MKLHSFAPAKINLYLHVGAPRADGFHPLDSLVVFARDAGDVLAAAADEALTLEIDGPFADALPAGPENLVLKAAHALAAHGGVPAKAALHLTKHLPIASGIGGGSADAAAALRVLNHLWGLRASEADLESVAATLGSDVAVCVTSAPAFMRGVGADLTPVEVPAVHAVLVNPGVASPTGPVYRALDAAARFGDLAPPGAPPGEEAALRAWLSGLRNDLESPAVTLTPAIGLALSALRGAAPGGLVRMSGSGATCFALPDAPAAEDLAGRLRHRHPDWWICATPLGKGACPVIEDASGPA